MPTAKFRQASVYNASASATPQARNPTYAALRYRTPGLARTLVRTVHTGIWLENTLLLAAACVPFWNLFKLAQRGTDACPRPPSLPELVRQVNRGIIRIAYLLLLTFTAQIAIGRVSGRATTPPEFGRLAYGLMYRYAAKIGRLSTREKRS